MSRAIPTLLIATAVLIAAGCSDDPLAPFEPEVVTDEDAFQFQVTAATDVTLTRDYAWSSSGAQVTVDHSTARTAGSAEVVILDADGVEVYRSDLMASGNESSTVGAAGGWTVRVVFVDFDGTVNFRVEPI